MRDGKSRARDMDVVRMRMTSRTHVRKQREGRDAPTESEVEQGGFVGCARRDRVKCTLGPPSGVTDADSWKKFSFRNSRLPREEELHLHRFDKVLQQWVSGVAWERSRVLLNLLTRH